VVRGAVAAGHPETVAAGAWALREGGNAVDAAIAAVCASLVAESPLTGLGAGGYMLVHYPGGDPVLLDFFVAAPGLGPSERSVEVVPVEVDFGGAVQVFNVGAASCGVPGTPAGLVEAARRFGTMPLADLIGPAVRLARDGVEVNRQQAYLYTILAPVLIREPAGAAIYAPGGSLLREGERFAFPDLADALELLAAEGASPFYGGEIAERICDTVLGRGGELDPEDLRAYAPIPRAPAEATFAGRTILTNPPPSSGGVLIALALAIFDRLGEWDAETLVPVMEWVQAARTEGFYEALRQPGLERELLSEGSIERIAEACRSGRRPASEEEEGSLGSTTHISAIDGEGRCASVTCSNGTGSGLVVPGTGVHVNNMAGEQDLNPFGFHRVPPGERMPSMMAPTAALAEGRLELALGSGGSNRIRSAITQTVLRTVGEGLGAAEAVTAPRLHFENGIVHAEPGVDAAALDRLEQRGYEVVRWRTENLFFGGVHTVTRDPATGSLRGGGDPRRGGAVAVA
jgi:gamma-glutamyltranspeptidase / glutathione hydrolase